MKVFPTRLFFFEGHDAGIDRRTLSGGAPITGGEDLVATDGGGRVTLELTNADLGDPEIATAWRAIDARGDGGAYPWIVSLGDARHQLLGDVTNPIGGLPWWEESEFAGIDPHASLNAGAALRATQITVDVSQLSGPVRGGIYLSIDHETWRHRAYLIAEVLGDNGVEAVLSIRPPLREATDADTPVEFYDPKCVMHVEGEMRSPTTLGYAEGSVRFVEDFSGDYA